MKKLSLLAVGLGSGALFAAGAAMAAPPSGFSYDDYTVNAGQITPGACPTGYTCQTLQNDTGFLQQRLSDGTAEGSYFRTIVVSDDASALDPTQVQNLDFRSDSFVGATTGSNNVTAQSSVQLDDTGTTTFDFNRGVFNDGTEPRTLVSQDQDLGDRTVAFSFEVNDDGSDNMRIDQMNPTGNQYSGPMTIRRMNGSYVTCDEPGGTGCVLELPDGQQLTYNSGDEIGTMYQHQSLFGMGDVGAANRVFENQTFTVDDGTGAQTIGWTNVNNTMDAAGAGSVTFTTINADGGAWDYWDDNFGAAPLGVVPPAGFPTDPFGP